MRDERPYVSRPEWSAPSGYGISASEPVAGFYRARIGKDTVRVGVELRYGPPCDPLDPNVILDRSWRWLAFVNGDPIDFNRVWPACAGDRLTEAEYRHYLARQDWAREHAPDSAYAEVGRRHDPLSSSSPMPF